MFKEIVHKSQLQLWFFFKVVIKKCSQPSGGKIIGRPHHVKIHISPFSFVKTEAVITLDSHFCLATSSGLSGAKVPFASGTSPQFAEVPTS